MEIHPAKVLSECITIHCCLPNSYTLLCHPNRVSHICPLTERTQMARRNYRRKWSASTGCIVTPADDEPDQWTLDLNEYLAFANRLRVPPGPIALKSYALSQRAAGMDPTAIANRVDSFKHIAPGNLQSARDHHSLKRTASELRKSKTNSGGPKRKPLVVIKTLMQWCTYTGVVRDLRLQAMWYIMLVCGCRPEELHTLELKMGLSGLDIRFNGRKNEATSGAAFLHFPFKWSMAPPDHIKTFLEKCHELPRIGSRKNVSSCFNSWLRKFHFRHRMTQPTQYVTSTCPRVRMDNVLRDLLDDQLMTTAVYEHIIGHTVNVSDKSYRR